MKKATLLEKIKGFFISPSEAFKCEQKSKLGNALIYGLVGIVIYTVLAVIVAYFTSQKLLAGLGTLTAGVFVLVAVVTIILTFIGQLISGLWLHLWAYIFGARNGLVNTIKAVFYGGTPQYFVGWIPYIKWVTAIWSLFLTGLGLIELQKMSKGRAAAAVIIAAIIPLIILLVVFAVLLKSFLPI